MKDNFKYFIENRDKLYNLYKDKYVAIKDCEVILSADTYEDALYKAIEKGHEIGTFIVQLCGEDESCYTQTFHTRVIFD